MTIPIPATPFVVQIYKGSGEMSQSLEGKRRGRYSLEFVNLLDIDK
jgi:hypothetical protein